MTRVYTLTDVINQLNTDSQTYIDTNPDELINQFAQGLETLKVVPTLYRYSQWTPYPWLVANNDGPTGFWLLGDPVGATFAFDSNPYGPKRPATVTGSVVFGQTTGGGSGGAGGEGSQRQIITNVPFQPGPRSRGAQVGGQVWASPNPIGLPAAKFDGSTGYVDAGTGAFDPSVAKTFTIEAWVVPTTIDASFRRVCGMEATVNHGATLYWQSAAGWGFLRGDNAAGNDVATGGTPALQTWSYVVGTYDGTSMRLYVNGALVSTTASSRSVDTAGATFRIGGTQASLNGAAIVSGVGVYPIALSAQQVANHYAWATGAGGSGAYTYNYGAPTKYGWFTYPLPPTRGSNRWGSAIWNNAAFTWG